MPTNVLRKSKSKIKSCIISDVRGLGSIYEYMIEYMNQATSF